ASVTCVTLTRDLKLGSPNMYTPMTLTDALHARGMRVTPQRLVIHAALDDLGRHATAEQVHDAVPGRLPAHRLRDPRAARGARTRPPRARRLGRGPLRPARRAPPARGVPLVRN